MLVALAVFVVLVGGVGGILWYVRKRVVIVGEFLAFLLERKLWWMTPIIVVFLLLFLAVIFAQSSPLAPFIYALF